MTRPKQNKDVKLFGGPLTGQTVTIPCNADEYKTRFFTYEYAGKQGRQECFALRPKSRLMRRGVKAYVLSKGKDPRIEMAYHQQQPIVNALPKQKSGRGARARAAKKESNG